MRGLADRLDDIHLRLGEVDSTRLDGSLALDFNVACHTSEVNALVLLLCINGIRSIGQLGSLIALHEQPVFEEAKAVNPTQIVASRIIVGDFEVDSLVSSVVLGMECEVKGLIEHNVLVGEVYLISCLVNCIAEVIAWVNLKYTLLRVIEVVSTAVVFSSFKLITACLWS